ncbi:DUF6082 family protein [Nocardiopsis coralliicola]
MIAALSTVVIAAAALVVASPLGLSVFRGSDGEWQRLSAIGQTYGAISALIAAIALAGVIATLVLQSRENRRAVQESRRQAMSDLLMMAMDDPDLDECWGPVPTAEDAKTRRQQLYVNMIVTQWGVSYETGAMPEKRLRAVAREMFSAPPGRAYWEAAREQRLAVVTEGRLGRFNRILDEEFHRTPPLRPAAPVTRHPRLPHAVGIAGLAVGAAAAAGYIVQRAVRRRPLS